MCPRHYIKKADGYMSELLFKRLIDEIAIENEQAIVLPFWRGESCLHPDFRKLMCYAFDKGIRLHISTNGHFMTQEFMEIFHRCEFVTFSLHNKLGYTNAIKMIEHKPDWSKTTTQITCVDSEKNSRQFIDECISDPDLHGFDSLRLYVEHTVGGEFGRNFKRVDTNRVFCPKLAHTFVVSSEGGYSRCNHIWEAEDAPCMFNTSIKEVWNSTRMNEIRMKYPDEQCSCCDQWSGHTNGEAWQKNANGQIKHIGYGGCR